tara:strand:- start:250 stop:408 length:159 start_codon:yes stop_codon:yes gene_type:complete
MAYRRDRGGRHRHRPHLREASPITHLLLAAVASAAGCQLHVATLDPPTVAAP